MEGHSLEEEENSTQEYSPYQLVDFDREGVETPQAPKTAETGETAENLPALTDGAGGFKGGVGSGRPPTGSFERGAAPGQGSDPTDFGSLQFQRENTLLTNAESYAGSIREEAQLYVRQLRGEVETLNAEAETRYEEAANAKAEAETEAARIIAEAQAEVESIREKARSEGFESGKEDGMTQRYEEAGEFLEHLESIMKELGQFRKRVAYYTEQDGIQLALLIAKKILHAELKVNKKVILKILAQTLSKMEGKGKFVVWVSAEDHQFAMAARPSLKRYLDESQSITFRSKPSLARGNILIETDREVIDLTFESQFYHLEQLFSQALAERDAVLTQPAHAAAPPEKQPPPASENTRADTGTGEDTGTGADTVTAPAPSPPTPPTETVDEG